MMTEPTKGAPNMNTQLFKEICKNKFGAPKRGWQTAAARATGVSQSSISNIWNDKSEPSEKQMQAFQNISGDISHIEDFQSNKAAAVYVPRADPDEGKTNEEIKDEIRETFRVFEELTESVICGNRRGMIVNGPAGSGKSYIIEKLTPKANGTVHTITTDITGIGAYKKFYEAKDGDLVAFDDCDAIFSDLTKVNMLKNALDTGKTRKICWEKASHHLKTEDDETIPTSFDFGGRILFMTNIDMDAKAMSDTAMSPHYRALLERTGYLSLNLKTPRRRMLRVVQVCEDSTIMADNGITDSMRQQEILDFFQENIKRWRTISLRGIVNLCNYYRDHPDQWKVHAEHLLMRHK